MLAAAFPSSLALLEGGESSPDRLIATDPDAPQQPTTLPGVDRHEQLSTPRTGRHTGTATVDLGPRPSAATAVSVSLSCLSPGRFSWPDGASLVCGPSDATTPDGPATSPDYVISLAPGQSRIVITADPGASWQITTSYIEVVPTAWATNAKGETFGVGNDRGTPDLVAIAASNGRRGYAYSTALDGPMPTSPAQALAWQRANQGKVRVVPVFESDGETVVGQTIVDGDSRRQEAAAEFCAALTSNPKVTGGGTASPLIAIGTDGSDVDTWLATQAADGGPSVSLASTYPQLDTTPSTPLTVCIFRVNPARPVPFPGPPGTSTETANGIRVIARGPDDLVIEGIGPLDALVAELPMGEQQP